MTHCDARRPRNFVSAAGRVGSRLASRLANHCPAHAGPDRSVDRQHGPLVGQLLFAEEGEGTITIDCLLTRAGTDNASMPVTLEARFPGRSRARAALELLDEWASQVAPVQVRIFDADTGAQVEITSGSVRLVLEPEAA